MNRAIDFLYLSAPGLCAVLLSTPLAAYALPTAIAAFLALLYVHFRVAVQLTKEGKDAVMVSAATLGSILILGSAYAGLLYLPFWILG